MLGPNLCWFAASGLKGSLLVGTWSQKLAGLGAAIALVRRGHGHRLPLRVLGRALRLRVHRNHFPLLLREVGSATRQLTERALQAAGVRYQAGLVLEHTEAIKRLGCGFGGDTARLGEGPSLNYGHLALIGDSGKGRGHASASRNAGSRHSGDPAPTPQGGPSRQGSDSHEPLGQCA
jgi:hypothetical protein